MLEPNFDMIEVSVDAIGLSKPTGANGFNTRRFGVHRHRMATFNRQVARKSHGKR